MDISHPLLGAAQALMTVKSDPETQFHRPTYLLWYLPTVEAVKYIVFRRGMGKGKTQCKLQAMPLINPHGRIRRFPLAGQMTGFGPFGRVD